LVEIADLPFWAGVAALLQAGGDQEVGIRMRDAWVFQEPPHVRDHDLVAALELLVPEAAGPAACTERDAPQAYVRAAGSVRQHAAAFCSMSGSERRALLRAVSSTGNKSRILSLE